LEKLEINFFIAEIIGARAGLHRRPAVIPTEFFGAMEKIDGLLPELFILQPLVFKIFFELLDFMIQPVDVTATLRLDVAQGF
jgi:hypothetical protein